MKKSLDFLNNIDTLGIDLDFSDPKVLKSMVEDNYSHVAKKIKNSNHHSHRFYSLLDFDKPRIKRRIEATLSSYPKVLEIAAPICPAIPGAFSIEEDWAAANATPLPSLDLLEERSYLTVAAAIWILDRAKAAGHFFKIVWQSGDIHAIIFWRFSFLCLGRGFSGWAGERICLPLRRFLARDEL